VLAGGVAAAVIGPEIARLTHDMFEPVAFGGSFAALALLACLALLVVQRIDIPVPTGEEQTGAARPLAELLAQPKAAVAVFAGAVGYAVMSLVMNATPLAMIACGMAFGDAARTIQAHVLAMFVPSFFTGSIIGRFGVVRVMAVGAALLLGSAAVVLAGIEFWNFYAGLILLGLGWNFLYIGATSLLTETYKPAEKAKMQAANDSIVFGSVALAAALSGWMHNIVGWEAINFGALPPVGLALAALLWLALRNRRRGAA
jgi:MFS family permease